MHFNCCSKNEAFTSSREIGDDLEVHLQAVSDSAILLFVAHKETTQISLADCSF